MRIPDVIGPIEPSGDDLKGIIHKIKNEFNINNPIKSKIITAESSGDRENTADATILWDQVSWQSTPSDYPWLQITFPKSLIIPTAYSIRGVNAASGLRCFAKSWNVYGIYPDKLNDKAHG